MNFIDRTGKRYGRLLVLEQAPSIKGKKAFLCVCDCGNKIITLSAYLRSGDRRSCGCLFKEVIREKGRGAKHGYFGTKIYAVWNDLKRRCRNKKHHAWKSYGGRGITVCDRWLDFKNFFEDMGETYKLGLSIDRKNNDLGYSKENCRWATRSQQQKNRRPRSRWDK